MAERRMFSKVIVQSARFLKMPLTSQALYFQLGVSADDDGIVEAFPVMRMAGAAEDDLRVLVTKNFVQVLNEDLVAYITDWSKNNSIRADRYKKSVYHNLILKMLPDGNQVAAKCQPTGNQAATNGRPSIGQESIGQESIGQRNSEEEKKIQGGGQGKYTTASASASRKVESSKIQSKESRARKFCPPSVAEVQEYCEMRQNGINAQRFVDYYGAKGWMIGKNKMRDWQAAVRTWESRELEKIDKPEQSQMPKADEPQYGICF